MRRKTATTRTKSSPLERQLQVWVERLVLDGILADSIEGQHQLVTASKGGHWLEGLSIDGTLRNLLCQGGAYVLRHIRGAEMISATRDISRTTGESLLPDLILHNKKSGVLIIVELKRDKGTSREAASELLAYEHEIRNHFPFVGYTDICFLLISTEYNTLLAHSIADLVMHRRRILCLAIESRPPTYGLCVVVPDVWHHLALSQLTAANIQAVTVRIAGDSTKIDAKPFSKRVNIAFQHVVREAERISSTGFSVLWVDSMHVAGQHRFGITLCLLDHYSIYRPIPTTDRSRLTPFDEYLSATAVRHGSPAILPALAELAGLFPPFLSADATVAVDGAKTWRAWRNEMEQYALPMRVDFWGAFGEFAREYVQNAAVRNEFAPDIVLYGGDWTAPNVGVPIVDTLIAEEIFHGGVFGASSVLRFGVTLGSIGFLLSNLSDKQDFTDLPILALLRWRKTSFVGAMRQIAVRVRDAGLTPPPEPDGGWTSLNDKAERMQRLYHDLAQWFHSSFLEDQEIFQDIFATGLRHHNWFDVNLRAWTSTPPPMELAEEAGEMVVALINLWKNDWTEPRALELRQIVAEHYLGDLQHRWLDAATLGERVSRVPLETYLSCYSTHLMRLVDLSIGPSWHKLPNDAVIPVDVVSRLRESLMRYRPLNGRQPVVLMSPDRSIRLAESPVPLRAVEVSQYVWVAIDKAAFWTIRCFPWSHLESGLSVEADGVGNEVVMYVL